MHKISLAGENSVLIYFGNAIDKALPGHIAAVTKLLKSQLSSVIVDLIPSYTSILVYYDISQTQYQALYTQLDNLLTKAVIDAQAQTPETVHIPVYYSTETGLDLAQLLADKALSLEEFIEIHSAQPYLIYAIGFAPAFAFLGEVDQRIQAPRLATPRVSIPAGSVGIAESQTAVYPTQSSGGWNIVGRTLLDLSLDNPENAERFKVGDYVQFYPITRDEYLDNGGAL